MPAMGEYSGVDVDEIVGRADALAGEFDAASAAALASAGADAVLAALDGMTDLLPHWPGRRRCSRSTPAAPTRTRETRVPPTRSPL